MPHLQPERQDALRCQADPGGNFETGERRGHGPEFDAAAFAAKVEEIQVPENGVLVFVFYDGHTVTKTWDNPSRRHSWNPENRQRARELALRQAAERRLAKCQQ